MLTADWWSSWFNVMTAHLEAKNFAPVPARDLKHYLGVYLRMIITKCRHQSDNWRACHRHPKMMMPQAHWEHVHKHRAFSLPDWLHILKPFTMHLMPGNKH